MGFGGTDYLLDVSKKSMLKFQGNSCDTGAKRVSKIATNSAEGTTGAGPPVLRRLLSF